MSNPFNHQSQFDNFKDEAIHFVENANNQAQKAWSKSSNAERGGFFAVLTFLVGGSLLLLIVRSVRRNTPHYIELPK